MLNNQVFLTHCLNRQTLLRILKDLQCIHSVLQKKISHLVSSWTRILRNWDFQIFLWEAVDPRITKLKYSTPK
jgi:hypothetical protein